MKIEITTRIPSAEIPKDAFVVEIEARDCDNCPAKNLVAGPFVLDRDEANLESLVTTLELMFTLGPVDGADPDFYSNVEGFDHWFGNSQNPLSADFRSKDSWPRDEYGIYMSFSDYRVLYYNADGEQFNTELSL